MLSARVAKIALWSWAVALLFTPVFSWAQERTIIELNPLCWQQSDCEGFFNNQYGAGDKRRGAWLPQADECDKPDWGKCLAVGPTQLSVSIGDVNKINDLAQYIVVLYNYAMMVAGIVAAIVIIISGVQWTVSGGSSEVITAAKNRIAGALVGLLIAYLSYAILNTLNPNLVNITTPQAFMVRPIVIAPDYCVDGDKAESARFFYAGANGAVPKPLDGGAVFDRNLNDVQNEPCGARFYANNGSNLTCISSSCRGNSAGKICTRKEEQTSPGKNEYECSNAVIRGTITNSYAFEPGCISAAVAGVVGFKGNGFEFPFINPSFLLRGSGIGLQPVFQDKTDGHYYYSGCFSTGRSVHGACPLVGNQSNLKITVPEGQDDFPVQKQYQYYKIEFNDSKLDNYINIGKGTELVGFIPVLPFNDACGDDELHLIGKNGRDLGPGSPGARYATRNNVQILPVDYFTADDLRQGALLNINVTNITPD